MGMKVYIKNELEEIIESLETNFGLIISEDYFIKLANRKRVHCDLDDIFDGGF